MGITETRFEVKGMKCSGCVAKAKEAIQSVAGITEAVVDLAEKSAVVKGNADPQAIIEALRKAGYPAVVKT